jgi:hypothetical protein
MNNEFDDVDSTDIIVLKDDDVGKYLEIIGKKGTFMDSVKLQFVSKYQSTAEVIVNLITRSFGWKEVDRRREKVQTKSGYELMVWIIEIEKIGALM